MTISPPTPATNKAASQRILRRLDQYNILTARDQALLKCLRDVKLLSLDQAWRLFWSASKDKETARKRLSALKNRYKLVDSFHISKVEMEANDLTYSKVFRLGSEGRRWLKRIGSYPGRLPKRAQAVHDLLVAEARVRITESIRLRGHEWSTVWYGETAASFYRPDRPDTAILVPDALGIIQRQVAKGSAEFSFFLEMDTSREGHGRPSSRIGRKIRGYDSFSRQWQRDEVLGTLKRFPAVLLVTHGEQRLQNLAEAILRYRQRRVAYALALRETLMPQPDFLTTSAWLLIRADSDMLVGQESHQRQRLLGHSDWLKSLEVNSRESGRR